MKQIYLVKLICGSFDDLVIINKEAFFKKEDAEKYQQDLKVFYDNLIDVDLYIDCEVFCTNDLIQKFDNQESFIDYADFLIAECNNNPLYREEIDKTWKELKSLYLSKYNGCTFSEFCDKNMYTENAEKSPEYSTFFAKIMKCFYPNIQKYSVKDISKAIDVYCTNWSKPYVDIEEIELYDSYIEFVKNKCSK